MSPKVIDPSLVTVSNAQTTVGAPESQALAAEKDAVVAKFRDIEQ